MTKEQANERLMYYYDFLFKTLKKGVKPLELLDDIEATAWEYVYQRKTGGAGFVNLYGGTCRELEKIKEALQ